MPLAFTHGRVRKSSHLEQDKWYHCESRLISSKSPGFLNFTCRIVQVVGKEALEGCILWLVSIH